MANKLLFTEPFFGAHRPRKLAESWQHFPKAVNSLLFGVSVVAAILGLLSLLRVTVFIFEISGQVGKRYQQLLEKTKRILIYP